jgi:PAS domain S-box-containing protein
MEDSPSILIIDDETGIRDLYDSLFSEEGYRISLADNGTEGLEKAIQGTPDLILLDVMMPGMDGFEVCRRLRADSTTAEIPIIMVTALNDRQSRIRGIEAGADDFINKPFDIDEMATRVRTIMRLNRYRRLVAERTKFDRLIEAFPDGIAIVTEDGIITSANPAMSVILCGLNEAAAGDDKISLPIGPDRNGACESFIKEAIRLPLHSQTELVFSRADGTLVPLEVSTGKLTADARPEIFVIVRDISERKLAEKNLHESEERFHLALNGADLGMWEWNIVTGRVTRNERWGEMLEYTVDETNSPELSLEKLLHPDDKERTLDVFAAHLRGEIPFIDVEYRLRTKTGQYRWILNRGRILERDQEGRPLRATGTTLDITDRKLVEQRVQESLNFLSELINALPIPLYYVDTGGSYLGCNKAFCTSFGYEKERVIGKSVFDLMPKELADRLHEMDKKLLSQKGAQRYEAKVGYADGRVHDIVFHKAAFLDIDGAVGGLIGVMLDVTEQKKIEEEQRSLSEALVERAFELKSSHKEIEQLKVLAENANRTKSEFLANMSHEIRTPMNGILGFSELLLEEDLTGEQHEYVKNIHESGRALLALINNILDLSKIESGRLEVNLEEFYLLELFNNALAVIRPRAREKGIAFTLSIDKGVPPQIVGDPDKIRQIITNLAGNAVKFTDDGSVDISVTVSVPGGRGDLLTVSVVDTGPGISPDKQDIIFDPFTQADSSTTRKYGGTGLGLAITKDLVTLLGGTIEVVSSPGKGSTFTFSIPIIRVTPKKTGKEEPKGGCILIIEDDRPTMKLYKSFLEKNGFEVIGSRLGGDALGLAKKNSPSLIILDIMLPDISGWEVLTRLKKDEATADIPVMVVSVLSEKNKAISLGAIDYLEKPINGMSLVHKIELLVGSRGKKVNVRIMIVDDDKPVLDYLDEMLRDEGFTTIPFQQPEEAYDYLKSQNTVDIIILDIFIPKISGFDFMGLIKEHEALRQTPIVFITGKEISDTQLKKLDGISHSLLDKSNLTGKLVLAEIGKYLRTTETGNKQGKKKPEKRTGAQGQGRILLVEDNPMNRKLITTILTREGYTTATATNGADALQVLEADRFDLILMDIQMPVMDGYEATRRIKADERLRSIPVIALTAHAMKGDEQKVYDAGCDGYLTKPVNREELLSEIAQRLRTEAEAVAESLEPDEELRQIIQEYYESLPGELENLSAALAASDYDLIRRIGHNLKGTGGAFGQQGVSVLGRQIENAARDKSPDVIKFLLVSLEEEIGKINPKA